MHLRSINFQQGCQDHSVKKEWSFQQIVLRQLDMYIQKNEIGHVSHTI